MPRGKKEENANEVAIDAVEDAAGKDEGAGAEAGEEKKYFELYARAVAELENFKKLSEKQAALQKFRAKESLVKKLLPVLDDLEAGLAHAGGNGQGDDGGLKAIQDKLFAVLAGEGLREIETKGKFDPFMHEAMQESESDTEPGTILQVVRRGYLLDDSVIRPAMVIVAKKTMEN